MSFDIYKCQRYKKYVDSEGFTRLLFFLTKGDLAFLKILY